jgi:2-keto-4-pentenoate hydratase
VEVELAFVLSKPLRGPGRTIFDVLNATDFFIPSLEILDSRLHRVDPAMGADAHDVALEPGHILLSGSFIRIV